MSVARLQGKIAVLTGGGRGLGRSLALALAGEGADLALSYRESRAGAESAAEAARGLGRRALALPADARVPGELGAFVAEAVERLGGVDILVNNAGVFRSTPLDALSEQHLDEAFDVNVKAAVLAPIPSAMTSIAVTANPGDRRRTRRPYRMSCTSVSSQRNRQLSRADSSMRVRLPNSRAAASRADALVIPRSSRASTSICR